MGPHLIERRARANRGKVVLYIRDGKKKISTRLPPWRRADAETLVDLYKLQKSVASSLRAWSRWGRARPPLRGIPADAHGTEGGEPYLPDARYTAGNPEAPQQRRPAPAKTSTI